MAPCLPDMWGRLETHHERWTKLFFAPKLNRKLLVFPPANPPKCYHTSTPIAAVSQPTSKLQISRQVNSLPLFSLFSIIGVQFVDNKRKRSQCTAYAPSSSPPFSFFFHLFQMAVTKGGGCNKQLSTSQNQNFMSIYFGVSSV